MALTEIPIELSSTPSIVDGGNATAITIDSSENVTLAGNILHAGDLTLDVAGSIIFDADGADYFFKNGGTEVLRISGDATPANVTMRVMPSDGDFVIKGNDGGSTITALTLDMSAGGAATFNAGVSTTSLSPGIVTISSGSYFIGNTAAGYRFNNAADNTNLMILKDDGTLLVGTTGAINSAKMSVNGNTTTFVIHPAIDNNFDCGHPSYRWDDIRATNGTIQTSDRNEKQDIEALSDAEQRVAVAAKGLMRKFRWKDSVAKKGDEARTHFGIIAQDLQDAFTAEGLDAGDYAMFISDTWWETQTEVTAVEATEDTEAVDAYTRTDTYDTAEEAPEGATERTRLGVRYNELLAFIISAI